MRLVIAVLLLHSWVLNLSESATHWKLQSTDIPPSHIPYFMRNRNDEEGFCKDGDCQVNHPGGRGDQSHIKVMSRWSVML